MAPRAYWKGYLKLSLVSCPIALFPATSEREKISFHQLNKETGNRIRYKKVDADTGDEVANADIIKGYELAKGEYIELEPDELEAVAIESKHIIDIEEFVPRNEIDELYIRDPYYIVPDGEVGQQAFAVIREAIRKEGMVALGKVVFTSREHIIALEARGKGMVGLTLRYPYEVRKEDEYFDSVEDEKIPKDMLDLAIHIVETKPGHFKPAEFKDQYEDALKDLLRKKQKGEKIERPKEREPSNVINLMDALKQSIKAGGGRSAGNGGARRAPAASSTRAAKGAAKKAARSPARITRGIRESELERDEARSHSRCLFEHVLFAKPASTFAGHALLFEHVLFAKPVSTPDRVRGRLFRDHARCRASASSSTTRPGARSICSAAIR